MSSSDENTSQPFLVKFYDPNIAAQDMQGRTLSTILTWDEKKLESCHDYIQIIFPLPESSGFGWSAPTVNKATFEAFRSRPELRARLRDSLVRILDFYGFELKSTDESPQIIKGSFFNVASRKWVTRFDHNHLRITRIIRSLRVLGLGAEAQAFFMALSRVYDENKGRISDRSMEYWTRAAKRPLYLAPDDDEDEGEGEDFLHEYESNLSENKECYNEQRELESETDVGDTTQDETSIEKPAVESEQNDGLEKQESGLRVGSTINDQDVGEGKLEFTGQDYH